VSVSKISDYTCVSPRFLRSVNLNNDYNNIENSNGYIITPNVGKTLESVLQGLSTLHGQRSFSVLGPYGTGKSAFAVFLCQLLGRDNVKYEFVRNLLANTFSNLVALADSIREVDDRVGFLQIVITARRRPVSQIILESMLRALVDLKQSKNVRLLVERIQNALDNEYWFDTAVIIDFLSEIGKEAKLQGYSGLLLMVDEAGKTLEYALHDPNGGDVYIYQELAEYSDRQKEMPVLFIITLHQMFDDYVQLSDRTLKNEWTKVQERFRSIQFSETAAATINLIANALCPKEKLPESVDVALDKILQRFVDIQVHLPFGIGFDEFKLFSKKAWPLHPTLLLAMPYLFRRLAQNERSIFSYLNSFESFGFQTFLDKTFNKDVGFVRLSHVYNYLLSNYEVSLSRLPYAKRLLEVSNVINSRQKLSRDHIQIIQTVALLNVLSEICPLRACKELIECSCDISNIDEELHYLKAQSLLTYRKLDNSYRVWEGSDVDVEERLKEAYRDLHLADSSMLGTLKEYLPSKTMVARRHSLETGICRYFKVVYTENISNIDNCDFSDAAGIVLVVLPMSDLKVIEKTALKLTKSEVRLIVALPQQITSIIGVVEEIAGLRWVDDNTPELRDDKVASREVSLRLVTAEQRLEALLRIMLDPRPLPLGNHCKWFWNGTQNDASRNVDVTRLLSKACDNIYSETPKLRNELIARKNISGAAAAGRRKVIEGLLEHVGEPILGIDINSYPPERAIYETVLQASDIHVFNKTVGSWSLQKPPQDSELNLRPCWSLMEDMVFSLNIERVNVLELFEKLSEIPYGLPAGVSPILFVAFFILNQDNLFLYRENSFLPEVKIAHLELLQRRPELFSVSGVRLDGIRQAVVERLAKGLKQPAKIAPVVRSLFKTLNSLPNVTLKTNKVKNKKAILMRDCLLKAQAPEQLLFIDLPKCFGLASFKEGEERTEDMTLFFEELNTSLFALRDYSLNLLEKSKNKLVNKCGIVDNIHGWEELERRAMWLVPRVNHEVLTPFLKSVINGIDSEHNATPALSLVANRPFEQWSDTDVDRFPGLADGIGDLFKSIWKNYGNVELELTSDEIQQRDDLCMKFKPQLTKLIDSSSTNVIRAMLKELLKEFDNSQLEE